MKLTKENEPQEKAEQQNRFYLLFSELKNVEAATISDVSLEEIDEIEQIRRMVMEVTDEKPIFMTST